MTDELLTISAAAREIGRDRSTLQRWIDQGAVPTVRLPSGRPAIRRADLAALIEGKAAAPVPERADQDGRPADAEAALAAAVLELATDDPDRLPIHDSERLRLIRALAESTLRKLGRL